MFTKKSLLTLIICCYSIVGFTQSLIVIRHGESLCNTQEVFSGDVKQAVKYPLTKLGVQQVYESAEKLKQLHYDNSTIAAVYVSPFLRTKQTADILVKKLGIHNQKIIYDNLLVETDNGIYEGKSVKNFPYGKYWDHSKGHLYGGETDEDVEKRIIQFLAEVKKRHYKNNVLVVTHGNPASILNKILSANHPQATHFKNAEFRIFKWQQTERE